MAVQHPPPHIHGNKGGHVMYDETYKIGNTTIHIVAPNPSEEEKEAVLNELYRVAWEIWESVET